MPTPTTTNSTTTTPERALWADVVLRAFQDLERSRAWLSTTGSRLREAKTFDDARKAEGHQPYRLSDVGANIRYHLARAASAEWFFFDPESPLEVLCSILDLPVTMVREKAASSRRRCGQTVRAVPASPRPGALGYGSRGSTKTRKSPRCGRAGQRTSDSPNRCGVADGALGDALFEDGRPSPIPHSRGRELAPHRPSQGSTEVAPNPGRPGWLTNGWRKIVCGEEEEMARLTQAEKDHQIAFPFPERIKAIATRLSQPIPDPPRPPAKPLKSWCGLKVGDWVEGPEGVWQVTKCTNQGVTLTGGGQIEDRQWREREGWRRVPVREVKKRGLVTK